MAITGSDKPHALVGQGTVFDGIAYWVSLAGVYLMVGGLMFYSGKGKLFDDDGNAPEGIKEQFRGTFLTRSRASTRRGSRSVCSSSRSSSCSS